MAGRKAAKSGTKKLKASADVKKKTLKKLKARRPENHTDLTAITRTKVLNIEGRGQDATRLVKRMLATDTISQTDDLAADLLLMRDGLLQKRLEGLGRIAERVLMDTDRIGAWGKRVMQELGPRIIDQERAIRRYAIQIMLSIVEGLQCREGANTKPKLGYCDLHTNYVVSHLKASFAAIQESISRDGLIYLHQLLVCDLKFALNQEFVKKIFPLVMPHARLLHGNGIDRKVANKKLWSSVNFFVQSMAPALSDWAALFCGTILLIFCSVCQGSADSSSITVSQILAKLSQPFIKVKDESTVMSTKLQVKKNSDDFNEITIPGSDFPLGILLHAVDQMIAVAHSSNDEKLEGKIGCLAAILLRWIVNISFGAELDRTGELLIGDCLPPRNHRSNEFYEVCVSVGKTKRYSLAWIFENLSLAVTIKKLNNLVTHETADLFTKNQVECLVAEAIQAIDVVENEGSKVRTRVHAHLNDSICERPYLGSGRGLVWDTYIILYKIFGKCAIPSSLRNDMAQYINILAKSNSLL